MSAEQSVAETTSMSECCELFWFYFCANFIFIFPADEILVRVRVGCSDQEEISEEETYEQNAQGWSEFEQEIVRARARENQINQQRSFCKYFHLFHLITIIIKSFFILFSLFIYLFRQLRFLFLRIVPIR